MSPPMTIQQTSLGNNVCGQCCETENIEVRNIYFIKPDSKSVNKREAIKRCKF